MVQFSAPGKLILLGEHAVVYGQPAIAVAVDLRFSLRAVIEETDFSTVNGKRLVKKNFPFMSHVAGRLLQGEKVRVETKSNIPTGAGLGSSAAVTVAATAAFRQLSGLGFDRGEIARSSFEVEFEVQGNASPIDTSAVTLGGGVLVFREALGEFEWELSKKGRRWFVHRCDVPALPLVIGDTRHGANTGRMVEGVRRRAERSARVRKAIEEIGAIVIEARSALASRDLQTVGELMEQNQEALRTIGVSHPLLEKLLKSVAPSCLGAKLTGAGGGGCIVCVTEQPERTERAIVRAGGVAYRVRVAGEGVRVESD